jgi:hypothetical protein
MKTFKRNIFTRKQYRCYQSWKYPILFIADDISGERQIKGPKNWWKWCDKAKTIFVQTKFPNAYGVVDGLPGGRRFYL